MRRPLYHQVRQRQEERKVQPRFGTWQEGAMEKGGLEEYCWLVSYLL